MWLIGVADQIARFILFVVLTKCLEAGLSLFCLSNILTALSVFPLGLNSNRVAQALASLLGPGGGGGGGGGVWWVRGFTFACLI